jgi:hypothetical protein
MEEATVWLSFVAGLVLRLGIPLGLTFLATWGLRKLDQRWQQEARELVEVGHIPAMTMIRCWVLNNCPLEKREKCPAYMNDGVPCWQVFRKPEGQLADGCLDCHVFRKTLAPEFA